MNKTKLCRAVCRFAILLTGVATKLSEWPFDKYSIRNHPIGDGANYQYTGFEDAGHVGVDIKHILETETHYPYEHGFLLTVRTTLP